MTDPHLPESRLETVCLPRNKLRDIQKWLDAVPIHSSLVTEAEEATKKKKPDRYSQERK